MTNRLSGRRIQQIAEFSENILHEHPSPSLKDEESNSLDNWQRRGSKSKISIDSFDRVTPVPSCETLRSFSSASSWTDDGFERPATEKVQALFEAIDGHLYDGQELREECKELQVECQDWINKYPHLRVNGKHLNVATDFPDIPNTEPSFLHSPNNSIASISNEDQSFSLTETKEITFVVRGYSLKPSVADDIQAEEIIEHEGNYEELIAVDYSDFDFDRSSNNHIKSDKFLRKNSRECITEQIWNKIVLHLRTFLVKYVELALRGPPPPKPSETNNIPPIEDFHLTSDFPLPRLPTAILMNKGTSDLDGLLTITSKLLLNRSTDKGTRTGSTVTSGKRQQSPQDTVLSKNSGRGRLVPLERSAKTATKNSTHPVNETQSRELVRQKVATHHPLSPSKWGRHFPLPPIESCQPLASSSMTLQQKSRPPQTILNRTMSENGNTPHTFTGRTLLSSNSFSVPSANTRPTTSRHSSSVEENDQSFNHGVDNGILDGIKDDKSHSGTITRRKSTITSNGNLKTQTAHSILNRPKRMSSSNNVGKKLGR